MTRMASVRAATVAMRSSGQMMVVIMEAGTTMPPMPRPARTSRPQSVWRLSTGAQARAPMPAWVSEITTRPMNEYCLTSRHENG